MVILNRIFFFYILLSLEVIFANSGVFSGSGAGIWPIQNDNIRLKSENVTFYVTIPENSGKYGAPFIPKVKVNAEFNLQNTINETLSLQIGFPFLDFQGFGDEESAVKKMDFRIKTSGRETPYSIKKGIKNEKIDPRGLFKKIFTWDDRFSFLEEKTVIVSYNMDMSVNGVDATSLGAMGLYYYFNYITLTAKTWKGPIDKAEFKFNFKQLVEKIQQKIEDPKSFATRYRPLVFFFHNIPNFKISKDSLFQKIQNMIFRGLPVFGWEPVFFHKVKCLTCEECSVSFGGEIPIDAIEFSFFVFNVPSKLSDLKDYLKDIKIPESLAPRARKEKIPGNLLAFYKEILTGRITHLNFIIADELDLKPTVPVSLVFSEDVRNLEEMIEYLERNQPQIKA
ncbi:MAG: hypothetical protein K2Q34_03605 [Alphaproteobacteria bacterium]|nr:hypothetical protein [Alphaproteobacteria bacterium]